MGRVLCIDVKDGGGGIRSCQEKFIRYVHHFGFIRGLCRDPFLQIAVNSICSDAQDVSIQAIIALGDLKYDSNAKPTQQIEGVPVARFIANKRTDVEFWRRLATDVMAFESVRLQILEIAEYHDQQLDFLEEIFKGKALAHAKIMTSVNEEVAA